MVITSLIKPYSQPSIKALKMQILREEEGFEKRSSFSLRRDFVGCSCTKGSLRL